MAKFVPVVSQKMTAVKYDREGSRLVVQFGEDSFYEYAEVGPEIVVDFMFADSQGSAFSTLVEKGGFQFKPIPASEALV